MATIDLIHRSTSHIKTGGLRLHSSLRLSSTAGSQGGRRASPTQPYVNKASAGL
jgi:hypothetical protein